MRARDIAGLVLDPKVAGEAERGGKRRLTRQRRHAEAAPVDRSQRRVELADQLGPRRVRQVCRAREPVRGQPAPVAQERVRLVADDRDLRAFAGATARGRRRRPPRAFGQANGKARGGSTTAPQPWQTNSGVRAPPSRQLGGGAALRVEFLDHRVPGGPRSSKPSQNDCSRARLEVLERHALLLDPGEIAEVEDPLAVDVGELEQVVDAAPAMRRPQVSPAADRVEAVAEVARRAPCALRCRTSRRRRWRRSARRRPGRGRNIWRASPRRRYCRCWRCRSCRARRPARDRRRAARRGSAGPRRC